MRFTLKSRWILMRNIGRTILITVENGNLSSNLSGRNRSGEVEEGEEAQGRFVVTGADATKAFELIEHALEQVALFVEVAVILPKCESMAAWRNRPLSTFCCAASTM